jgi:uncharacterized repeat protein (TIGR01451 family)
MKTRLKKWTLVLILISSLCLITTGIGAARSGGPDYFGYTFKDSYEAGGPSYNWIDITSDGAQILPDSDDSYEDGIPVGFFFNFYGTDYSNVSITNNGIILARGGTSEYSNQPIGASSPHNFILPYWDDIVTWNNADAVYYKTIGEAPNRKFIVEWNDTQHYSSSPKGITFEAILFEGSNNILFQYKDLDFGYDGGYDNNGSSATVGIEGPEGLGLQYSYDEPAIAPEEAILFTFPQYANPNLYLSKQAPVSKDHGSSMTYTLFYSNFANLTAQNVVLQDRLPNDVEFESASDGGVYDQSARTVTWDIGKVDARSHGYRTLNVNIPATVDIGTVITNNAHISTTDLEVRLDDNDAQAQTRVTGSTLPSNVSVEPTNGGIGTPSVFWGNPVTFSYHSCPSATAVDIRIHVDDGGSDIVGNMAGGPPDWSYNTTFYPRHGSATVTYTVHGCAVQNVSFSIYIDPAGYIYDIDTGQRIEGASVYLQRQSPDGTGDWENVPTDQDPPIMQPDDNPLITDHDGMYHWDTLEGSYRVHVEAPGYEPNNSIVVSVPPPVTDLHVGLHHPNAQPVAAFVGAPYEGMAGIAVTLNGSSSYDPDHNFGDSIVSYDWDLDNDGDFDASGATVNNIWDHAYSGQVGLRVTDSHGAVGTAYTGVDISEVQQDLVSPVIQSAVLFPANTTAGSKMNITVNATDNVGVTDVKAGTVPLYIDNDGFWKGNITAPSSRGDYSLLIKANDSTGNSAETSVPYHVVQLTGGSSIAVSPKTSSVAAGSSVLTNINVKNLQNIDDTFKVWISVSDLSAANQANLGWFNDWTEQNVQLKAGEEKTLPMRINVSAGTAAGTKLFRVNVKSATTGINGLNTGYLKIT